MKRRASDNNHQYMIGINTWLFGVGAILVGYNAYVGLPLDGGNRQAIFADLTQAEALTVSSFAIMMAGFFYSLIVLKPDMLMRNRERKLIALKAEAGRHSDFSDPFTGLSNLQYFKLVMDSYLEEAIALDKTLGVLVIEVNAQSTYYKDAMLNVANTIESTARDYDVVAKIDLNKIAVLTPNIAAHDLVAISNRYQAVLSGQMSSIARYDCIIGFAASNKTANTSESIIEVALNNLTVNRRLSAPHLRAVA
ncbi:MAG: diguanylate cyclase [Rhizobiaceae bacterium]|nr:diguanylate cyclase [Rhizobiaceae bacterium]